MSDGDWDLYAVVRSCTNASAAVDNNHMEEDQERNQPVSDCSSLWNDNYAVAYSYSSINHGLEEICEPFSIANTGFENEEVIHQPQHQGPPSSNYTLPITNPQCSAIQSRRRKNQHLKMVYQMTQEELSGDTWAWRKYGQKPIKGSPYPRNYYRCSTLKGCAARKQVERSPTDPTIFIVSYTGEHAHPRPTHRSSLAGSTRSKFSASAALNNMIKSTSGESSSIAPNFSPSTSPTSALTFSPPLNQDENAHDINTVDDTETMNVDEDYQEEDIDYNDDNVLMPNQEIFKGLQEFDANSRYFD